MKQEYYQMFKKAKEGLITSKQWQDYCAEIMRKVIEDNIAIFERMKDK